MLPENRLDSPRTSFLTGAIRPGDPISQVGSTTLLDILATDDGDYRNSLRRK